jgi:hypothetical protein
MGYWMTTAMLKNNRRYDQALVNSETSRGSKNYEEIPFAEAGMTTLLSPTRSGILEPVI